MRIHRLLRPSAVTVVLAFVGLLCLPGCQTYVNIPAQTGDVASANVNGSNVRNILGEALRGMRGELLKPGRYQIILPAGATPETYNEVLTVAGEPYTWANSPDSASVVDKLEIRSIRVRGWEASVDVIRSSDPSNTDAPRQLVTIYLKQYVVGGWSAQRVRIWRLNVQDALLISSGDPVGEESKAKTNPEANPPAVDVQPDTPHAPPAATQPAATEPAPETQP
jgi:hypothetical protein